jgi:hypothetical protein
LIDLLELFLQDAPHAFGNFGLGLNKIVVLTFISFVTVELLLAGVKVSHELETTIHYSYRALCDNIEGAIRFQVHAENVTISQRHCFECRFERHSVCPTRDWRSNQVEERGEQVRLLSEFLNMYALFLSWEVD